MATNNSDGVNGLVTFQTAQGPEIRAHLVRMSRFQAVFEICSPDALIRTSEVLSECRILLRDRMIYQGKALVSSLVHDGAQTLCEAKLEETGFTTSAFSNQKDAPPLSQGFSEFLLEWQQLYRVRPEFKVVVADMLTFLSDLRLWLESVEFEIRSAPAADRLEMERRACSEIGELMVPAFNALHERLENVASSIEEELRPVHQRFSQRQLHPLVMCSPFAYRTFTKPLGYAGDYEMVNMILRDPYQGASLFAKILNLWFLRQWPAKAHRNRIDYLKERLREESLRGARRGLPIRVLNLGCGPAGEIQQFLSEDNLCEHARFTLLDFNEETIQHTLQVLGQLKKQYGRRTPIEILKKSVQQVLKEGARPPNGAPRPQYDLIYCAGLFDYLPDRTCRQVMNVFYDWLAPEGLLAATNVDDAQPFRHMLEFVLDWHLIYRNERKGAALLPERAEPEYCRVRKDPTRVNIFIEARKPAHG